MPTHLEPHRQGSSTSTTSTSFSIVLVAPIWRGQPWFPVLLGMLIDYPRRIPSGTELAFDLNPTLTIPYLTIPHLAVLHISGRDKEISIFQTMLLNFLTDGEQNKQVV